MATIKITDALGFVVETETAQDASITRYFRDALSLNLRETALNLRNTPLKDFPLASVRTGLDVEQEIDIGNEDTELTLSAGLTAGFTVFKKKGEAVLPGRFGEEAAVKVGDNEAWVSFDITPTLSAGLTTERGDLTFGFEAGTEVSIFNYRPFRLTNGAPKLASALADTVSAFSLPGDVDDLRAMAPQTILSVDGKASLSFTAGLAVSAQPNPLASINAPGLPGSIDVKVGGAVSVQSSYTLSGGFELRVRKLDTHRLEFGYFKSSGRELKVAVTGSAGVSVGPGDTDLTSAILRTISGDPKVDEDELRQAGLAADRIRAIRETVEAGVDRSLELSLAAEFSSLRQGSAAFLYEIDLNNLDEQGAAAVRLALDGDLTRLMALENELPPGVEIRTSIFQTVREKRTAIRINLLGIFNFISISKLLVGGEVLYNHETGELVLTDKATAERIRATLRNFAVDSEKLHEVQMESFLFTAAYRGSKLAVAPPELKSRHSYFELHARTNRQTMKDNLDVAEALGLVSREKKAELLGDGNDFRRSTLYAETGYGDDLLQSVFLDDERNARSLDFYEQAGRKALTLLYQTSDPDEYRRQPALDDGLWKKMRAAGSPQNVMALFPTLEKTQRAVVYSDYLVIVWWAKAMHELAEELVKVHKFFADHPNVSPGDNGLRRVRKRFRKRVTAAAKTTKKQFGEPWGLIAMDIATNHQASANVRFTGDVVAYENDREQGESVPV